MVREEILKEYKTGGYDLLVLGAPLARQSGEISISGLIGQILAQMNDHAVLMIRSHFMSARAYTPALSEHAYIAETVP
jgi:hypothetical protein